MPFFSQRLVLNDALLAHPYVDIETEETIHAQDRVAGRTYYPDYLVRSLVDELTQAYGPAIPGILAAIAALPPAARWANVDEQLQCPIAYTLMEDPVIAADGHTYERAVIEAWFEKHDTSPMTNDPIDKRLVPNHLIKACIDELMAHYAAQQVAPPAVGVGGRPIADILAAFQQRREAYFDSLAAQLADGQMMLGRSGGQCAQGFVLQGAGDLYGGAAKLACVAPRAAVTVPVVVLDAVATGTCVATHSIFNAAGCGEEGSCTNTCS